MTREEAVQIMKDLRKASLLSVKGYIALDMAIQALSESEEPTKTQMVDKSNFDIEQYKVDLQSAYDFGYNQACKDKIISPYKSEKGGEE